MNASKLPPLDPVALKEHQVAMSALRSDRVKRIIGSMFEGEWRLLPYSEAAHYMARGQSTPDGWYKKFRLWVEKGIVDYKINKHTLDWERRELDTLKTDRLVTDVCFEREQVFLFLAFELRGKRCRQVTELGLYDDPREWDSEIRKALKGWLRMISCIEHGTGGQS